MSKALRVLVEEELWKETTKPTKKIYKYRKTCNQKKKRNFLHKIFINNYKIPSFASTTKLSIK